jgi:hypothetical protein
MTIRTYIKVIEDITTRKNDLKHFFVDTHGFKSYSHGPHHKGFFDKSESKLSIKDMLEFLNKEGYKKVFGPAKVTGGYVAYSFEKNGGYYTDDRIDFDTSNGKFVRNANRELITDKT